MLGDKECPVYPVLLSCHGRAALKLRLLGRFFAALPKFPSSHPSGLRVNSAFPEMPSLSNVGFPYSHSCEHLYSSKSSNNYFIYLPVYLFSKKKNVLPFNCKLWRAGDISLVYLCISRTWCSIWQE